MAIFFYVFLYLLQRCLCEVLRYIRKKAKCVIFHLWIFVSYKGISNRQVWQRRVQIAIWNFYFFFFSWCIDKCILLLFFIAINFHQINQSQQKRTIKLYTQIQRNHMQYKCWDSKFIKWSFFLQDYCIFF